jgi:putative ATP-binding cassette transporter
MPLSARASIIVSGLKNFANDLLMKADQSNGAQNPPSDFRVLSVKESRFTFQNGANGVNYTPFSLQVRDFELKKGEMVFLRGGNGSGKTTFMRLLAGLYLFDEGGPVLDDVPQAELGEQNYRGLFSVLFSEFHLFEGLYGIAETPEDIEDARKEIKRFSLDKKVTISDSGRFSTVKLSSGQKKRLALAVSILEKRPILLFDEVAADFDHSFREFFYRTLLPSLKAEGRTLLVISHDERFFDVADRVVTLEYGEFV